jgi:hypothetical protein
LNGIKYLNGHFVAVGDGGAVATSADGITWVSTTAGTLARYRKSIHFYEYSGHYILSTSTSNGYLFTSTNLSDWVSNAYSTCSSAIVTAANIIIFNSGTFYSDKNPTSLFNKSLSTSSDGGNAVIVRKSTQKELIKVKGGLAAITNGNGGNGGSSTNSICYGGGAAFPAAGIGGNGGVTTTVPANGTGGATSNNMYGGGGCPLLETMGNTYDGVRVPGAGGAYWVTSSQSGGGGSILTRGGAGYVQLGIGGGQSSNSQSAGGGGEGIVRATINVTPGEILLISSGMAQQSMSDSISLPSNGIVIIEWEE